MRRHAIVDRDRAELNTLLRSNLTVTLGTTCSRVTGLIKIMVFGWVIGQTALSDAYIIANETPNITYELLLGGLLSAALIPLFSSFMQNDDDEATGVVVTIATTLMLAVTAVAVLAAPLIFKLYTLNTGESVDHELFQSVGTSFTRIFLIQIFFYGLTGLASAFLNSRRQFFAAAWSPVASNIVVIASLLTLRGHTWQLEDVANDSQLKWTLSIGATAGIATTAVLTVLAARKSGYRIRPTWNWKHPAVRQLLRLSGWTFGFVAANQVAVVVVRNFAEPGSSVATAYFFAFTFFVLPHGLFAVSIATTFQPDMAGALQRQDRNGFIEYASLGVRLTALFTIPAGLGIFVLRQPIVEALLQYHNFDAADARATIRALAGFSIGLAGFSVYYFVLRAFYAHKDTRTPFLINVTQNLINIILAFALVGRYDVLGLSVAYAISYLVTAALALHVLNNKVEGFPLLAVVRSLLRMCVAGVLMAEAIWFVTQHVEVGNWSGPFTRLALGVVCGPLVYAGALVVLRAPEIGMLKTVIGGRRK